MTLNTLLSVSALMAFSSVAGLLESGLAIARILGLPVSSWRAGDPTRALFHFMAEHLFTLDAQIVAYIKSAFLSTSEGDFLDLVAVELYGVTPPAETFATPKVTIENQGSRFYDVGVGDLTVKATSTGKTFRCTSTGVLSPGAAVEFELIADEGGADSTVAADEIDSIVTTLLGCVITSSTAATARDKASPDEIRALCRASLGALSPNGPPDAYAYVATNAELTGVQDVTRARGVGSTTGDVTIYVASDSGVPSGASITAVQDAIELWANPLCATPDVVAGTPVTMNLTITGAIGELPDDAETLVSAAWSEALRVIPISAGEATDVVDTGEAYAAVRTALTRSQLARFTLVAPAADLVLAEGQFPVPGAVSITEA
jgi:hypothetical protein